MMIIYIDDEHCMNLIKSALGHSFNSSKRVERSTIKALIYSKLYVLKEDYSLTHEEIFSEVSFNFLRKSILYRKFDSDRGGITTFILHYVLNQLRDIEKKCIRGTFRLDNKKPDAMKLVVEDMFGYIIDEFNDTAKDGIDYDNPENLLIAKQTFEAMQKYFSETDLNNLINGKVNSSLRSKLNIFKDLNDI